jgi:prepilin peptidase CpaA
MTAVHLTSLALACVACAWDLRTRRIPQALTIGGALAGFCYHVIAGGSQGATLSALGWLVGMAIFFAPFALGGLGAGDVKLLGALGAWLGVSDVIWVALYTGMAGGVLALVVAAWSGYLRRAIENLRLLLIHWRVNGIRPLSEVTLEGSRGPRLAYALPILVGTVTTVWLR